MSTEPSTTTPGPTSNAQPRAGVASSAPFRVFDPQALGVDLQRVVSHAQGRTEATKRGAEGLVPPSRGPTARVSPRQRVLRVALIVLGCATCLYAGRLARERTGGLFSPASALALNSAASAGEAGLGTTDGSQAFGHTSPIASQTMSGASYELFDSTWTPQRAVITRLELSTPPRSPSPVGAKAAAAPAPTGEVRFLDAQGREQRRALDTLLALQIARSTNEDPWDTSAHDDVVMTARAELDRLLRDAGITISWLELVDGQRWSGQLSDPGMASLAGGPNKASGASDDLSWISPVFGPARVPLDRVRRIVFADVDIRAGRGGEVAGAAADAPAAGASAGVEDTVRLRNGDVLQGLVEIIGGLSSGKPIVRIDAGKAGKREVPLDTVAEINLTNPADEPSGTRVFLSDGSVLSVSSLRTRRDQEAAGGGPGTTGAGASNPAPAGALATVPFDSFEARISLQTARLPQADGDVKLSSDAGANAGPLVRLDRRMVTGVVLDAARVRPIHSVQMSKQSPSTDRRWSMPARRETGQSPLGLSDVALDAPMSVEWALPDNAQRFAAIVELGDRSGAWSDCEVVLSVVTESGQPQELSRVRLTPSSAAEALNLALPAGAARLTLGVNPGRFGPVQDGVRLREATLLTQGMR